MFENYREEVLKAYNKKKEDGSLSANLIDTSTGKLRDECLIVHHERYSPKDDPILRTFFLIKDKDKGYIKSIEQYNINGLRQLVKVLNGKTLKPGNKYIELLAWLIDFQPRPYQPRDIYEKEKAEPVRPISESEEEVDSFETTSSESKEAKPQFPVQQKNDDISQKEIDIAIIDSGTEITRPVIAKKFEKRVLAFAVTLIILFGSYIFYRTMNKQCMYWAGDHYVCISCDEKSGDAAIIALDTFKVAHFKKITRLDTVTKYALGRVWYAKINVDSAEFYTSHGNHPKDGRKRLLPVTKYMIDKYILGK